jgi:uncharacterized protein (TIGR03382 family)
MKIHHCTPMAALVLAALLPGAAMAQSTWNLIAGGGCTQGAGSQGTFGNNYGCSGSGNAGTSATAYAFSTQNPASGQTNHQAVSGTQYANGWLSPQGNSGFGVANRNEGLNINAPDHAIDNNPTGSYDMVVLNFNTAVVLTQVGIGWSNNSLGSDLTIMRWTGGGTPLTTTATPTVGGNRALLRDGWTLVSSLADVLADNQSPYGDQARNTFANTSQASSWWMIAAFNTTLNTGNLCYRNNAGGTYTENQHVSGSNRCDDGDDYFKLNYLRTTMATPNNNPVSAPGTLALAGLGLLGAAFLRRRA